METIVLKAAEILFKKKLAFCIYRLPSEQDHFRLAIAQDIFPNLESQTFWMAPFVEQEASENIFWKMVPQGFFNETHLAAIARLPEQKFPEISLPEETSKDAYFKGVQGILEEIKAGKLRKAVFSRVIHQQKPEGFNPLKCFVNLAKDYPDTFSYLSVHPKSGIWMGASPELLLSTDSGEFHIMALAGTQPGNVSGIYSWRKKEIEEHQMVGQHIQEVCKQFGLKLVRKVGPETVEAGAVVHLRTDFYFQPGAQLNLKIFLTHLHPTPAVGGLPVKEGIQTVLSHEGYSRRYYCGFIGTTDFKQQAHLFINLRNMQIGSKSIALFVGGGITGMSDPDEEWEETIMKSKTMIREISPDRWHEEETKERLF